MKKRKVDAYEFECIKRCGVSRCNLLLYVLSALLCVNSLLADPFVLTRTPRNTLSLNPPIALGFSYGRMRYGMFLSNRCARVGLSLSLSLSLSLFCIEDCANSPFRFVSFRFTPKGHDGAQFGGEVSATLTVRGRHNLIVWPVNLAGRIEKDEEKFSNRAQLQVPE